MSFIGRFANERIRTAVKMWIRNRSEALLLYGHIRDWDTSGVSDMSELFFELYQIQ